MPTLNWIGKDRIINHHQEVPFRTLEKQYTFKQTEGDSSKIIRGDNLEALKALLPQYENRVKCIYIDPPYNTGNEGWVYNDNVNDPRLKKWLGQVVGKEAEDLSRHDKWLCMMYPRLKLLNKLLADDGAIFISIDDNEQANLKLIMDEIFGGGNFVSAFVWKKRAGANDAKDYVSIDHEYVICYRKSNIFRLNGIQKDFSNYQNPDNDERGVWTTGDLTCNKTKNERPNLDYEITDPKTGITYPANPNRVWAYEKGRMQRAIDDNKIIFPKNGKGTPQYKRHLDEVRSTLKPVSTWIESSSLKESEVLTIQENENISILQTSLNASATKELRSIFGSQVFDYPKPIDLIQEIVSQITNPNDIILDSFAGSGTTAHAVMNLNKADGGNRQFILIEMNDYAETITAERVRRVIEGYGNTEGTGGSFDFYTLGEALFDEQGNLNTQAKIEAIREYIWFTETRSSFVVNHSSNNESGTPPEQTSFLGTHNETDYYFCYDPNQAIILDMGLLAKITQKASQYLIYADSCELSEEFLNANNIIFKKIPRDITRL